MILEPIINLPNSSRIAAPGAANNGSGIRIAARGAAGNGAAAGKGTAGWAKLTGLTGLGWTGLDWAGLGAGLGADGG